MSLRGQMIIVRLFWSPSGITSKYFSLIKMDDNITICY